MDVIAEIRRRHLVESETISSLAIAFKLSRPTIRKHLKTVEEPAYLRKHQPHPMLGSFHEQLHAWLGKRLIKHVLPLYRNIQNFFKIPGQKFFNFFNRIGIW